MKNILLFISILFFASCGSDNGATETTDLNEAPTTPSLLNPTNNLLCISSELTFEWAASTDTEGDAINYYYEVATDNMFNNVVKSGTVQGTSKLLQLEKETAYYWRVQATDSKGDKSDFSETWNLYTENIPLENHLPFMPELISPSMKSTVTSNTISLTWNCADIDNDALIYNVFIGKGVSLEQVATGISDTYLEVPLDNNANYSWKVEAIDSKNGKTIGQIWNFTVNF